MLNVPIADSPASAHWHLNHLFTLSFSPLFVEIILRYRKRNGRMDSFIWSQIIPESRAGVMGGPQYAWRSESSPLSMCRPCIWCCLDPKSMACHTISGRRHQIHGLHIEVHCIVSAERKRRSKKAHSCPDLSRISPMCFYGNNMQT